MARSYPAQTMGQVSVLQYKVKDMPRGGTMKTHYNYTLQQAMRAGVLTLDNEGKILEILEPNVNVQIPEGWGEEDVFAITKVAPIPDPEMDPDSIVKVAPIPPEGG